MSDLKAFNAMAKAIATLPPETRLEILDALEEDLELIRELADQSNLNYLAYDQQVEGAIAASRGRKNPDGKKLQSDGYAGCRAHIWHSAICNMAFRTLLSMPSEHCKRKLPNQFGNEETMATVYTVAKAIERHGETYGATTVRCEWVPEARFGPSGATTN